MTGKIAGFFRELICPLCILLLIVGLILIDFGILWFWLRDIVNDNEPLFFIKDLGDWNAYLLVIGIIILFIGIYYLFIFYKNRKFLKKELKINKRSELLKKQKELRNVAKHLPKKYQKQLKDKEDELNIK